jgi:Transposase
MERRTFTREFKLEAVKLIQERGVTVAQAARDLGVHGTVGVAPMGAGVCRRCAAGLSGPGTDEA